MKKHYKLFMKIAELWAEESHCKRNKVGAVLVKDGEIFAHGYNGTLQGDNNNCEEYVVVCPECGKRVEKNSKNVKKYKKEYKIKCPVCGKKFKAKDKDFKFKTKEGIMHAEQNAILFSARDGKSTKGATMFVTTSPCINCASMIFHAGIKEVVYKNEYKDTRGIELLRRKGIKVVKFKNKENKKTFIDLDSINEVSVSDYERLKKQK